MAVLLGVPFALTAGPVGEEIPESRTEPLPEAPGISVSPEQLHFSAAPGGQQEATFTVTNTSDRELWVAICVPGGTDTPETDSGFRLSERNECLDVGGTIGGALSCRTKLAPGETRSITVRFVPPADNTRTQFKDKIRVSVSTEMTGDVIGSASVDLEGSVREAPATPQG